MATRGQNNYVIGVDVGGTKVAAGFVSHAGEISDVTRVRMVSDGDAAAGLNSVVEVLDSLLAKAQQNHWTIRAIGICAPGPLDPNTGVVINPPNVPCWRNFPLAAEISKRYHLPAKIENDANAAALAEVLWGAGKGYAKVFYITIGTGVGTGLILDGHIYNGRTGAAAEGGHVSIDYRGPVCGCGKRGCIEALISGTAIAKRAQAKLEASSLSHSPMLDLAGGKIAAVTCELVNQARAAGDPIATATLLETVELLAVSLGNTIDLLEPDVIIVGGGVAGMLQPFFDELREHIPSWCINSRCREIPLLSAHYGANSGIAGGAALCT
ncbi:MAG TPA: ROK family protein [Candidatus Acidoferrales bacterium]|nr:ROK family protein [Candidatus Acidoferrales bacterium]